MNPTTRKRKKAVCPPIGALMRYRDRGLSIDDAMTPKILADYSCRCGTKRYTRSMLAPAGR
jgi:hypothetical protein